MTTIRAPLSTVLAHLRTEIEQEAKEAAGTNTILSKVEQKTLKDSLTKSAADEIRASGGPGTTVTVDALVERASSKMEALIGTVNQASGPGASAVSQAEVKALAAANPDAGVRVARAYELITGKKVNLEGIVPLPVPHDAIGELNAVRDAVKDYFARALQVAAGSNAILSATERASLPSGHLRDAAFATPSPRTVAKVTAHLMSVVDQVLMQSGVDIANLGKPNASGTGLIDVPLSRDRFFHLVGNDPEIAGLLADGVLATTGTRPENISGLPPVRFVGTVTPTPNPSSTWPAGDIRRRAEAILLAHLSPLSGGNQIFSAAERAALDGIVRDAALAVGTPCTSAKIAAEIMRIVDASLVDVGIDPARASSDPSVVITEAHVAALVLLNPEIAGLVADAMAEHTAPRVDVAGLPPMRFLPGSPDRPIDPALTGPVLTGVHGANGVVRTIDPARVDAVVTALGHLVDVMDYSRNGTVTIGEANSFLARAADGSYLVRMLYDVREEVYQRHGRSPTTSEIKSEVARYAERAKRLGVDESDGIFDENGRVSSDTEPAAHVLFDAARNPPVDIYAEPYVRFFDHEGDVEPSKRRPLDLSGDAARAVKSLVFQFNKAGNDNHRPLWSGTATSRYRLDVEETTVVVARIKSEPPARRAELFQALVDWLSRDPKHPGLAYVNVDARHLVDALAVEVGHPYRSPVGDIAAPAMPPP
jgi:hypothetical protein